MAPNVSKTLIRDARSHLKSNFAETATILRTGVVVPCLVVVQRWAVPLRGVLDSRFRVRKWNILMPSSQPGANPDPAFAGSDVLEGDRISVPGHGVFMVLEVTDPNTYNVATSVWSVLTNAQVSFERPRDPVNGHVGPVDVFIQRVTEEDKSYGVKYEWEVSWDSSIIYPNGTLGGSLISKDDNIIWNRSPNPLPGGGMTQIDKPRYAYGANGRAIVSAYFNEVL